MTLRPSFLALLAIVFLSSGASALRAAEFPDEWTWDSKPEQRAAHAALEGKPAPPLILSQWINGQVNPADWKGKVVLVDFYATWCGPCMRSIPHNNELLKKYKDKGLVVIGACTSSHGQEKFTANAKEHNIEYPAACDTGEVSSKAWQADYYPTYAPVDRKGIVRVIGLQPSHVEEALTKLLAESAP